MSDDRSGSVQPDAPAPGTCQVGPEGDGTRVKRLGDNQDMTRVLISRFICSLTASRVRTTAALLFVLLALTGSVLRAEVDLAGEWNVTFTGPTGPADYTMFITQGVEAGIFKRENIAADELVHDIVPLLVLLFWWRFAPKGTLRVSHIVSWLGYPAGYLAYSLARGAAEGWYPYYFLDVNTLGYPAVLKVSGLITVAIVLMSALLVAVDRRLTPTRT